MRFLRSLLFTLVICSLFLASCASASERKLEPSTPVEEAPVFTIPQEEEAPEEVYPKRFTLVSTGDLMVHQEQLLDAYQTDTGEYDFSHCFAEIAGDLAEGYAIGNLETVFGGAEIGYSDYPQFNTPDSFGEALKESGFDFVTTANNHCLDKYEPGLLRTLEVLDSLGLGHTGTFASPKERDTISIVEIEGAKVALLAYTFSTNGIPVPQGKEYLVNMIEEQLILKDLNRAKELGADLIAVFPHMGNEYELEPLNPFIRWMDFMIENGADLVLASHPHVLQRMALRELTGPEGQDESGFVIYSMGNFISSQRYEPREISIILKLDFVIGEAGAAPELEQVRFVPTWVQFYAPTGEYFVRVLPIYDALESYASGENKYNITGANADRLYRAHGQITSLYLGQAVPKEEMQREYTYYRAK